MKKFAFLLLYAALLCLDSIYVPAKNIVVISQKQDKKLPSDQLIIVITDSWNNLQGTLYGFSRIDQHWVLQFRNKVVVGSKGLGVGDGLLPVTIDNAPIKKEGDLKAPAGIFKIGTAFGYADKKDAAWIKNPYVKASDTLICVDDLHSASYNKLIRTDVAKNDWKSHEDMHRKDNYYQWGLFINHNADKTVPGDGSCIFMHIWKNDHSGTEGCTAMKKKHLLRVLRWIDAAKQPLLVQLPKANYLKLRAAYNLPEID